MAAHPSSPVAGSELFFAFSSTAILSARSRSAGQYNSGMLFLQLLRSADSCHGGRGDRDCYVCIACVSVQRHFATLSAWVPNFEGGSDVNQLYHGV